MSWIRVLKETTNYAISYDNEINSPIQKILGLIETANHSQKATAHHSQKAIA